MLIKKFFKRVILGYRYNSKTYIAHLQKLGMKIGKGTVFFAPSSVCIDATRPWLISIGDNVQITKGVTIGNNVIIGANSLVNKDVPDNVVVAGNPAVVVSSLEEYYNKRKKKQIDEAKELVRVYRQRYNREVDEKALHEFFFLFEDGKKGLHPVFQDMMRLVGNEKESYEKLLSNTPPFENMQAFLNHISDDGTLSLIHI